MLSNAPHELAVLQDILKGILQEQDAGTAESEQTHDGTMYGIIFLW